VGGINRKTMIQAGLGGKMQDAIRKINKAKRVGGIP
jgi:hypothetical protein